MIEPFTKIRNIGCEICMHGSIREWQWTIRYLKSVLWREFILFFFFFFISLVGGGDICFPKLAKLLLHTSSLAFASFCSIIYQVCIARRTD